MQNPFFDINQRDNRGRDNNRGRDDGRDRDDDRGREIERERGNDRSRNNNRGSRWNFDPRVIFPPNRFPFPQADVRFIQNGTIQRVFRDGRNGMVTVRANLNSPFGLNQIQIITLVVTPDTILRNQNLMPIRLQNLQVGMQVFAAFSSRMTRSLPPQAVAYSIIAVIEQPFVITNGVIAYIDLRNNFFITGPQNDISRQVRYQVTSETDFFNRFGQPIIFSQLRTGDRVRIEHANFQTASIPPQTTAYRVDLLDFQS